ncbi:DUF3606 domain-containing protein [Mucilaginibacter terrae]|uniref:DUF3606 domain-containing protein n=1 Tax=Mucilaginibacter terrae TaxID=1955052 RepID=A0ABU3GRZ4_9SPHI|nr:DUF3606 domain-containing protein [Mucilaginibacter terrae]MDT3402559.1 hypothetical protein [Mucilaginibacter terrae]
MDHTEYIGNPDRDHINIHENYEVEYWSKKFSVNPEQLRQAVKQVGTTVTAVKEYFSK